MPATLLMLPPQNDKTRDWGRRIAAAHPELEVVVAETREGAEQAMPLADAAYGTIPPDLLPKAQKLRWLQAPQAAPPAARAEFLASNGCIGTAIDELVQSSVLARNSA